MSGVNAISNYINYSTGVKILCFESSASAQISIIKQYEKLCTISHKTRKEGSLIFNNLAQGKSKKKKKCHGKRRS